MGPCNASSYYLMIFTGEAWELEEDWEGRGRLSGHHPPVTTVGHMDQALLPQKHYFQTSPSHQQPPSTSTGMVRVVGLPIVNFLMRRSLPNHVCLYACFLVHSPQDRLL